LTGLSALTLLLIGLPPAWWARLRRRRRKSLPADPEGDAEREPELES
jgi:hypothetical protein